VLHSRQLAEASIVSKDQSPIMRRFSIKRFLYPVHHIAMAATASNCCELDSHADTFVACSNTRIMQTTGNVVNVHGFSNSMELKDVPIATVATFYVDQAGNRSLLVVHQALYLGAKHHRSLVNPNQLRQHGLAVDDCLCQFDPRSKHAIFVPESNLSIPLHLEGIISYFESFAPTDDDMEALPWVELTCAEDWEPYSIAFTE
jgi:hypothetical protein